MGFLSSFLTSDAARFVGKHAVIGLIKISGRAVKQHDSEKRNTQCIKLAAHHDGIDRVVMQWCNLRINRLQQIGASEEQIKGICKHDASFLTTLSLAIAAQKIDNQDKDVWLFFNDDIQSTDFFELQYCSRNSNVMKASYAIHSHC